MVKVLHDYKLTIECVYVAQIHSKMVRSVFFVWNFVDSIINSNWRSFSQRGIRHRSVDLKQISSKLWLLKFDHGSLGFSGSSLTQAAIILTQCSTLYFWYSCYNKIEGKHDPDMAFQSRSSNIVNAPFLPLWKRWGSSGFQATPRVREWKMIQRETVLALLQERVDYMVTFSEIY